MTTPILVDTSIADYPVEVYDCSDEDFDTVSHASRKITINLPSKDYDCSASLKCKDCKFFTDDQFANAYTCFPNILKAITARYSHSHPELFI